MEFLMGVGDLEGLMLLLLLLLEEEEGLEGVVGGVLSSPVLLGMALGTSDTDLIGDNVGSEVSTPTSPASIFSPPQDPIIFQA